MYVIIYYYQYMELRQSNKPYHTDHSIVYSCQYHVIFCPKYRRKVLTGAAAERMRDLVVAKQAEYGYAVMDIAVQPDHVHLLLDVDPRVGINVGVAKNQRLHLPRIAE